MSEFQQNFKRQSNIQELLTFPLTDFSAMRVSLYPKVSSAEFRKNLFRLLAHGRAVSVNGKAPSVLASLFQCASAENILGTIQSLGPQVEYFEGADIYDEFIESSYDDKEFIIRHAADNSGNQDAAHAERRLDMFIYTKMANNLARKYNITWIPKSDTMEAALVIQFEQSSLRNINIMHPPGANREITLMINAGATVRNPGYESTVDVPVTAWAFYWDAEMQPTYVHTYLNKPDGSDEFIPSFHSVVVPPFDRMPVMHAIGKEWLLPRFVDERASQLLRDFTSTIGLDLRGTFTKVTVDRSKGTCEVEGGGTAANIANKLELFFQRLYIAPNQTAIKLSYTEENAKPAYLLGLHFQNNGTPSKRDFVAYLPVTE